MEYYLILAVTTAIVTLWRIYNPVYLALGRRRAVSEYLVIFIMAMLMFPLVVWLTLFFPQVFQRTIAEQLKKSP